MRITNEGTVLFQAATAVGSGGTVVGTGVDWSPYYQPEAKMIVATGATPSGTLVATLQQGTALASGYSDIGTITTGGSGGGTATFEYNAGALTARYLRVVMTSTGGTTLASASILGKRYTTS